MPAKYTPEQRIAAFWANVNKDGPLPYRANMGPCWPWMGPCHKKNGYGMFSGAAHRFSWTLAFGAIPDQMTLDHVCHTTDPTCRVWAACEHRRCVNPSHLEVVTRGENTRRGHNPVIEANRAGVCLKGHPTILRAKPAANGQMRDCLICQRETGRAERERLRHLPPVIDREHYGVLTIVERKGAQRLYVCPCGERVWSGRGKAARHARACPAAGLPADLPPRMGPGEPKNECLRGHPFDQKNTRVYRSEGILKRACRACNVIHQATRRKKKAACDS